MYWKYACQYDCMDVATHLTRIHLLVVSGALLAKAVWETVTVVLSSPPAFVTPAASIAILSRVQSGPRSKK